MSADVRADWYTDFFTELLDEFSRRAVPPGLDVELACFSVPDGTPFAVGDGRLLLTARRGPAVESQKAAVGSAE